MTLSTSLVGTHPSMTNEYSLVAILMGISPFLTVKVNCSSDATMNDLFFSENSANLSSTLANSASAAVIAACVVASASAGEPEMSGTWISEYPHSDRTVAALSFSDFLMKTATTPPSLPYETKLSASGSAFTASVGSALTEPTNTAMDSYPLYNSKLISSFESFWRLSS